MKVEVLLVIDGPTGYTDNQMPFDTIIRYIVKFPPPPLIHRSTVIAIMTGFCLSFFPQEASSYEYEPFACYYELKQETKYRPALKEINDFTQQRFEKAIVNANKLGSCSYGALEIMVKDQLDDEFYGQVENFASEKMKKDYRCKVATKNSVYAKDYETTSLNSFNMIDFLDTFKNSGGIDGSVYICDTHVGTDKFGHFMAQGHTLFERLKSGGIKNAIAYNIQSEEGLYGLRATSVKSYGDMSANLSGMYFWKNLYSKDKSNPKAYVTCEKGKFVQIRTFNWCDYVNPSWDEANNCSEFTEEYSKIVQRNLKTMSQKFNKKFQCPMDEKQCEIAYKHLQTLIGDRALEKHHEGILNPTCYELGKAANAGLKNTNSRGARGTH